MTIAELIEQLKKFPEDSVVYCGVDEDGCLRETYRLDTMPVRSYKTKKGYKILVTTYSGRWDDSSPEETIIYLEGF